MNATSKKPNKLAEYARKEHKEAARYFGAALALGNWRGWRTVCSIFRHSLSAEERAAIAWAALRSLDMDQARIVASSLGLEALPGGGVPETPLLDPASDARLWASYATDDELDAYAVTAIRSMSPGRRAELIEFLNKKARDET